MNKLTGFFLLILLISTSVTAQNMFRKYSGNDIGNPKLKGSFQFDEELQQFTLAGAGYNMWFGRDEFYLVSQKVEGDFILSANLEFLGEGVDAHRKIGLIIRSSNDENAVYMDGAVHGDGLTSLQYREKTGAETLEKSTEIKAPEFVQVERKGDVFIFRISKDSRPLIEVGRVTLKMGSSVFAGMFISSHNIDVIEKARFWNLRLEKPAAENINGYQTPSPSRLEILDIETGNRKVVYETKTHIEAPNWSRNGKYLIYNSAGKLYKFNLKNSAVSEIETDFATSNNNDHGISFDGKMLAISNHLEENGERSSIIYTVPVKGGTPVRIT
ncbi:MAG: biopolymer transporter TolR, partial [Draconibacterium sp.]|nr:biopolymer transporter TolR [Draconibacterium sp.]